MANLYNENSTSYRSGNGVSTLTAFFDSRDEAERAVARLKEEGISTESIRFLPGYEAGGASANVASDDRSGFWARLEDWLFPDEDRAVYAEGLRRGGFLVSVQVDDANYDAAHDILDDEGSIDMDERADLWRSEGWEERSFGSESRATGYAGGAAGDMTTTEDAFTPAGGRETHGRSDETIPVVEENLRVGKRDVNTGSVRVRAYTVEQPVRESVALRDEAVEIERRAVDRPLSDADRAFQDRTISAEEHHEEAVVSKDARVVEEIGIRKTASDRTETVEDKVRKTEVEIEDERVQSQRQSGLSQDQGFRRS